MQIRKKFKIFFYYKRWIKFFKMLHSRAFRQNWSAVGKIWSFFIKGQKCPLLWKLWFLLPFLLLFSPSSFTSSWLKENVGFEKDLFWFKLYKRLGSGLHNCKILSWYNIKGKFFYLLFILYALVGMLLKSFLCDWYFKRKNYKLGSDL